MQISATLRSADADAEGLTWFRATSEAKDRHGTIIRSQGVDVGPFLKNPVVGWGHRAVRGGDPEDVLGRVDSIERGDDFVDVGIRFADHERAQLTAKLVRDGFLSAVSVGLLPRKTATEKINGERVPVIRESELLEVSLVPVGSNPEAQRLLRNMTGDTPKEYDMETTEIRSAIKEAVKPLGERLEAIEKSLDEPESTPALAGARTTEDERHLLGRWMQARAAGDSHILHEIASHDPAPDAEVRDMLSAANYLPTQVGTRLIRLVSERSGLLSRIGKVTGSGVSIQLPREKTKPTVGAIAENTTVINSSSEIDEVTLTAVNFWAGERVPNRALADSPVQVADFLMRTAADKHAENLDAQVCLGTDVSGTGLTGLSDSGVQDDDEPLATLPGMVATQLFALSVFARSNATFVINSDYAEHLAGLVTATENMPVFALTNSPTMVGLTGGRLMGVPTVVQPGTTNVAADTAYLGDLSRSVMMYERQGLTGESSRDAEFALDNTLFRFGWRYDIAVVEANQALKFTGAV
jgi:HK97 family phage major capsid protein/HK97 family phage prohead protease